MPKTYLTNAEYMVEALRRDNVRLRNAISGEEDALIKRIAQVGHLRLRVRQLEAQLRRNGIEPEPAEEA